MSGWTRTLKEVQKPGIVSENSSGKTAKRANNKLKTKLYFTDNDFSSAVIGFSSTAKLFSFSFDRKLSCGLVCQRCAHIGQLVLGGFFFDRSCKFKRYESLKYYLLLPFLELNNITGL